FGGQTGIITAAEHPDRVGRLVLHASGLPGPTIFSSSTDAFKAMSEAFTNPSLLSMRGMMNAFLYNGERYSDEDLMLQERLDSWLERPELDAMRRKSANIRRALDKDIPKVKAPVLQLHGRDDRIAPLESAMRLQAELNDSRLVV